MARFNSYVSLPEGNTYEDERRNGFFTQYKNKIMWVYYGLSSDIQVHLVSLMSENKRSM